MENKERHNLGKLNSNAMEQKNDEYYTPKYVVEMVAELADLNFTYDPATTHFNAERLGIDKFDTIETNGLEQDWNEKANGGDIWINPPFSGKHKVKFANKAAELIKGGYEGVVALLTPDKSISNKHFNDDFKELAEQGRIGLIIPGGRVNFIDRELNQTNGNFFGSVIWLIGIKPGSQQIFMPTLDEYKKDEKDDKKSRT